MGTIARTLIVSGSLPRYLVIAQSWGVVPRKEGRILLRGQSRFVGFVVSPFVAMAGSGHNWFAIQRLHGVVAPIWHAPPLSGAGFARRTDGFLVSQILSVNPSLNWSPLTKTGVEFFLIACGTGLLLGQQNPSRPKRNYQDKSLNITT
jgi:hypothetical protein